MFVWSVSQITYVGKREFGNHNQFAMDNYCNIFDEQFHQRYIQFGNKNNLKNI